VIAIAAGIILGALSAFSVFRHHANSISFNSLGYTLVGTVFGSSLVYVLGSRRGFVHWILTRRALRYLGKTSYTFYLYHSASSLWSSTACSHAAWRA
jgi:peptidoglycan/LPS O-acetylase OafA/YrhL